MTLALQPKLIEAACGLVGQDVGPPRSPLRPAARSEKAELRKALKLVR